MEALLDPTIGLDGKEIRLEHLLKEEDCGTGGEKSGLGDSVDVGESGTHAAAGEGQHKVNIPCERVDTGERGCRYERRVLLFSDWCPFLLLGRIGVVGLAAG